MHFLAQARELIYGSTPSSNCCPPWSRKVVAWDVEGYRQSYGVINSDSASIESMPFGFPRTGWQGAYTAESIREQPTLIFSCFLHNHQRQYHTSCVNQGRLTGSKLISIINND